MYLFKDIIQFCLYVLQVTNLIMDKLVYMYIEGYQL